MKRRLLALTLAPALWLAGCTDPAKAPAQAALVAADAAVLGLDPEVERLAPEPVKAARLARAVALAAAERQDWSGALAMATTVPARVKEAVEATAARRAALAAGWAQAQVDVPNLLYALEDRLDAAARRPPAGLGRAGLAELRRELAALEAEWAEVPALAQRGEVEAAVSLAGSLEGRARAAIGRAGGP